MDAITEELEHFDLVVIGGGPAGFFGAIACAEARPKSRVLLVEGTPRTLTKVKVSGGGRCNVTHHEFEPKRLVRSYPRGHKELLGPFHRFQPQDTVAWFKKHGVELKVEEDGRMFPLTNSSQTIIDCLEASARTCNINIRKKALVQGIAAHAQGFLVSLRDGPAVAATRVLVATGSMPFGLSLASTLGHTLVPPVPSLFTFEITDPLLAGLAGISFPQVSLVLTLAATRAEFIQEGPCLVTHWGLSGPAVLKLSAFAARELHAARYAAQLSVNWESPLTVATALDKLVAIQQQHPQKKLVNEHPFHCPRRFWESLLRAHGVDEAAVYGQTGHATLRRLAEGLTRSPLTVCGKGVFKEEFVSAGGVAREEVDFRTMESKICPGVYFAGEVLDVDGITGGFNFQNAWTGGWLAGRAAAAALANSGR